MEKRAVFMLVGAALVVAVPVVDKRTTEHKSLDHVKALLEQSPLIDTHNDMAWSIRLNLKNRLSSISLYDNMTDYFAISHTDIPRMREGKMGAQFWSCYAPCSTQGSDAVRMGLEQLDLMKRVVQSYPEVFQEARTADEIEAAFKAGKIASLYGLEGGHIIDSSMGALRMMYDLGVRYMTLTHSCNNPWADGINSGYPHQGLTEFGRKVVVEMNRLGMMVDMSHVSEATMNDVLEESRAPVIFSHSCAKGLCDRERNAPDYVLEALAANGGVIMIDFYNLYLKCNPVASVRDVADQIEYVRDLIGAQYVGLGSDFDAIPLTPFNLEDTSKYPNIFNELQRRGWSDDDMMDVAGRNLLRVMRAVEQVAITMANETPQEDWIPQEDVKNITCRSDF